MHGTWDQLSDLAPNIPIYRPLKRRFAVFMGSAYGGTTHTNPDSSTSVKKVSSKAMEHNLHIYIPGCKAKRDVKDILLDGSSQLKLKGIDTFMRSYKAWVNNTVAFPEDDDDIEALVVGNTVV